MNIYDALILKAVGGGGGTTVVANPEGEATDELEKLQVGNDIYEIPKDYEDLDNKPQINGETLSGNKTASDLGLQTELKGAQTLSGNPITITDAEAMNAESVLVELEPKQDLHGYDAPWVGGSGKNKLPLVLADIKTVNTSGTWSGNTYALNGVTFEVLTDSADNVIGIKVNGTASTWTTLNLDMYTFEVGNYIFSNSADIPNGQYVTITDVGALSVNARTLNVSISESETHNIYIGIDAGTQTNNTTFYPMIRLSTESDATFEPYSNICPITGYSEVNVERVGKNWLSLNELGFSTTSSFSVDSDNSCHFIAPLADYYSINRVSVKSIIQSGVDYTISAQRIDSGIKIAIEKNNTAILTLENGTLSDSLNVEYVEADSLELVIFNNLQISRDVYVDGLQLELGNQATTYEPYQGNTYTVSLGGTKYGGTLDVTEGGYSDEWGYATLDGTETWILQNNNRVSTVVSDNMTSSRTSGNLICSAFETRTPSDTWFGIYGISCQDDGTVSIGGITDVSEFITWLQSNPISIAYRKKTPSSISTTPTDIPLLENTNNISTDGTNITLKYQPNNVIGECKVYTDEKCSEVLPPLPTTDGTYHLSCEVTSGVGVLSWVSDS